MLKTPKTPISTLFPLADPKNRFCAVSKPRCISLQTRCKMLQNFRPISYYASQKEKPSESIYVRFFLSKSRTFCFLNPKYFSNRTFSHIFAPIPCKTVAFFLNFAIFARKKPSFCRYYRLKLLQRLCKIFRCKNHCFRPLCSACPPKIRDSSGITGKISDLHAKFTLPAQPITPPPR